MSSSSAILAFQLGDRVLIEGPNSVEGTSNKERSGTIKYIGKTEFKEGDWLGVELDTPTGKNDGSVAGIRYFTCEPFHGLFVPPNKARLNLSGGDSKFGDSMFSVTPSNRRKSGSLMNFPSNGTPNHLDKIENLQMDFSAVKDISDSFGKGSEPTGLKTPTSHVKSQSGTPATAELKSAQNDIFRLRDQILAIKSDLNGNGIFDNRETVNSIVNKLSGMLETYEQVSAQYENQLKQFLMARKASKLDSNNSNEDLEKLRIEYEKVRNDLYNEIKENDQIKTRTEDLKEEISRQRQRISQLEEELQNNRFARTELEIEMVMEEEHHKRQIAHENELKSVKARHEEELKQKKMMIADLQNEVAFLKQSEKVLEEELNSRRYRYDQQQISSVSDDKEEIRKLSDELFAAKRQSEEFKRLWEDSQASKLRSEEYYRGEIERIRKESQDGEGQFDELRKDLKELGSRLKQTRNDNEELTWALDSSRKETERNNMLIEEQAQKLNEREKKLQAFSDRIRELEGRELQSREVEVLQDQIKKLSIELGEEKLKSTGPIEQLAVLKRKISLIEREKELLEEQLRTFRLSAYSQGEFQTFSTFIQGLKRHIEAEILSIEPLKLTLQDVVRAKEMVEILLKVTEDVRVKVLNHLSQVEEVIKSRFMQPDHSANTNNREPETFTNSSGVETVKIDKNVRNYDSNTLSDLRRRIDFRTSDKPNISSERSNRGDVFEPSRTLREPLGITSVPGASSFLQSNNLNNNRFNRSNSNDSDLESRMNNFRNLVSDLRSRSNPTGNVPSNTSSISRPSNYQYSSNHNQYSSAQPSTASLVRAHEPIRCNLCQEYGHDTLSCPDYLSGSDTFSEDLFLKDVRNSKFNSRFSERTRV